VSKLVDMLRKSKGEIADAVVPLIEGEVRRNLEATAPVMNETSRSSPSTPAQPEAAHPAKVEPEALARVRTIALRVPAPSPLLPFDSTHANPSEQYRMLRTRISHDPRHPSFIVVTSPAAGDGKSVTSINMAAALALKSEGRVLLLDADLRKSAIHVQLGLTESPGLADVLAGGSTAEEVIMRTREFPNLYVMPAGAPLSNPAELLDSKPWRSLCAELRGLFRYVIIDSPPVGGLADYDLIQEICDGVILVLRPDATNRDLCQSALRVIPERKFLGVVLNCIPNWSLGRPPEAAYYGYSRQSTSAAGKPADSPQD
jgi:capsular exopolysaccharide synthesis family protein